MWTSLFFFGTPGQPRPREFEYKSPSVAPRVRDMAKGAPLSPERAAELDARKDHYERQHPLSLSGGRFRFNRRQSALHRLLHQLLDEDTGRLTHPVLLSASTGDGKTDVALSMYVHGVTLARAQGRRVPKMLAIVDAQRGGEIQRQLIGMGIRAHVVDGVIGGPGHPRKGSCNKLLYSSYVDAQAEVDVMIVGPSMYQTLHTWKSGYAVYDEQEGPELANPYDLEARVSAKASIPTSVKNTRRLLSDAMNNVVLHPEQRAALASLKLLTHGAPRGGRTCTVDQAMGGVRDEGAIAPPLSSANASILYEFLFGDPSVIGELDAGRSIALRLDPDRDSPTSELCAALLARMHGAHCNAALSPLALYGFDYDFLILDEFPNRHLITRLLDRCARDLFLRPDQWIAGLPGPPLFPGELPVYPLILSATPSVRLPCRSAFRMLSVPDEDTEEAMGAGVVMHDLPIVACRSIWGTEQPSALERISVAIAAAECDITAHRSRMHHVMCLFDPSQEEVCYNSSSRKVVPSDLAILHWPSPAAMDSGAATLMSALLGPYRRDASNLPFEEQLRRGVFRYFVHAQKRRYAIQEKPPPPSYDEHLDNANYPTSRMVYYFLTPLIEREAAIRRYEQQPHMRPLLHDLRSSNPKDILVDRPLAAPLYQAASECFREALGEAFLVYPRCNHPQQDLATAVYAVLEFRKLQQLAGQLGGLLELTPPCSHRRREAVASILPRLSFEVAPTPESVPGVDLRRLYVAHAACRVAVQDREQKGAALQASIALWGLVGTNPGQLTERCSEEATCLLGRLLPRLPHSDRLRLRRLLRDRHEFNVVGDTADPPAPSLPPLPSLLACGVPSAIQGIGSAFSAMPMREEDYRGACTDIAQRLAWTTPGARRVLSVGRISDEPVAGLGNGKDGKAFRALRHAFSTNMDAALWVRWRGIEYFYRTCFDADRYVPKAPGAPRQAHLRDHGRALLMGTFDYDSVASEMATWIQGHMMMKRIMGLEGVDQLLRCDVSDDPRPCLYRDRGALRSALLEVGVRCNEAEARLHLMAQLGRFRAAERLLSEDGASRFKRRRVDPCPPGWPSIRDGLCEGAVDMEQARQWVIGHGASEGTPSRWGVYFCCVGHLLSPSPRSQVLSIPSLVQNIMKHIWAGSPARVAPVVSYSRNSKPIKTLAEDVAKAHRRAEDCDGYIIHVLPKSLTRGTNAIAQLGGALALVGEGYADSVSDANNAIQFKGRLQRQCPPLPSVPLARSLITMCGNGILWDEALCASGPWGRLFQDLCRARGFRRVTHRHSLQRAVLDISNSLDTVMFAASDAYTVVSDRAIAPTEKAEAIRGILNQPETSFSEIIHVDASIRGLPKQSSGSQHRDALLHYASARASQETTSNSESYPAAFPPTYQSVRTVFDGALKRQRHGQKTPRMFAKIGIRPRVVLLRRACAMEVGRLLGACDGGGRAISADTNPEP